MRSINVLSAKNGFDSLKWFFIVPSLLNKVVVKLALVIKDEFWLFTNLLSDDYKCRCKVSNFNQVRFVVISFANVARVLIEHHLRLPEVWLEGERVQLEQNEYGHEERDA